MVAQCDELVGGSAEMQTISRIIERISGLPSTVLIEGESGTGKELIARALHERRAEQTESGNGESTPYLAVNCGGLTRTLLESQLFGHRRGAFTGAERDADGIFLAARRGTLFLDEITALDLDLQVRLLRALQERQFYPLGSTEPVPFRARIIAATNQPMRTLVAERKFRADLYWRLNVVNIHVPPLRDRIDDLSSLVEYFLHVFSSEYDAPIPRVSREVMEVFLSYHWPGNIRELRNSIERVFAVGADPERFTLDDLPPELLADTGGASEEDGRPTHFKSLEQAVREHLTRALEITNGVKGHAANLLKMDRNRLSRMLKKYGIETPPVPPENGSSM